MKSALPRHDCIECCNKRPTGAFYSQSSGAGTLGIPRPVRYNELSP
jgi:hypothetical protein